MLGDLLKTQLQDQIDGMYTLQAWGNVSRRLNILWVSIQYIVHCTINKIQGSRNPRVKMRIESFTIMPSIPLQKEFAFFYHGLLLFWLETLIPKWDTNMFQLN
jgi:hypothetical protein